MSFVVAGKRRVEVDVHALNKRLDARNEIRIDTTYVLRVGRDVSCKEMQKFGEHWIILIRSGNTHHLHPWPFHVRELEQSLRAAAAIASSGEIDVDDLRWGKDISKEMPVKPSGNERERLVALLEKHAGNLSAIARELETSRSQGSRLLARHGLDTAEYENR